MENKILIFVLLLLVMNINLISGADWDNTYDYDPETKTATIENLWGLPFIGSDLAYITLTSPSNVLVARGEDRLVGEFNFTTTGDFQDTFGNIYLTNMKNGNEISRGKQFKYKKYKNISVDDYEFICEDIITENGTIQDCISVEVGNHWEIQMDWIPINNPTNIFYEGVTYEIGVFVDVEAGDWGDWVPSIMGVQIKEWSTWTESLNVDLVLAFNLSEQAGPTGTIIDSTGGSDGTNNGAVDVAGGIINRAYDFELSNTDTIEIDTPANIGFDLSSGSYSVWFKPESLPSGSVGVLGYSETGDNRIYIICYFLSAEECTVSIGSGGIPNVDVGGIGSWTNIITTWDGSNSRVYVNGVLKETAGYSYIATANNVLRLGGVSTPTNRNYDGIIDEFYIWNRVLDDDSCVDEATCGGEIEQLYNGGGAITWTDLFGPIIEILFPQNITYSETITQLNYTNSSNAIDCWFSVDGGLINSSAIPCGTNFTTSSTSGVNIWTVYGNSSSGDVASDSVIFFVNKTVSTELIFPVNNSNSTITNTNFSVNSTPINTNLTNVTLYIWHNNGTLFLTNTTTLSGDVEVQTNFTQNLSQGNFLWNAETCGEEVGCQFADDNNTLIIHTTPATVVIHDPSGTITFLEVGGNLTLNWTISEAGQNLTEHIQNCSYIYDGIETPLNLSQCIEINQTSFLYVAGVNNLTFKVIDIFGLITTNITTWDFLFEKYNVTFNNQTFEGTIETFRAEVILGGGASISEAIFYYNDTNYTTSIIFSGGEYTIASSITIPSIIIDTNFSLGFYLIVDGTTYNLQTFEQEVLNVNMSLCGSSDDTLINISLYNEETKVGIVGDIEINAQAISKTSGDITASFNTTFSSVSSGRICLSPVSSYAGLYFSTEIRYVSDPDFVPEFYYIQLADMADYPRNLSLFDLATNDSTEFLIKYQDDDLIPTEGAIIQLQRKYISEDLYEIVEAPLTSNLGTAVVHIDLNTNRYRATVVKDGVILDFFDNLVFDCENELSGECTHLLLGTIDPQNDVPLIQLRDFAYTISSEDETITTVFIIPSGTPASVNIVLSQMDQFGNETTCNQTIISSGGSIDCSFNLTIGDSYLSLKISKDGLLQAQQTYIVVEDSGLDFLGNNFFIVIIILLSLVGMAISSPEWMIINSVVVMLIGGAFWLLNGMNFVMGLGSLVWLVISAGILIYKLSKQEDR